MVRVSTFLGFAAASAAAAPSLPSTAFAASCLGYTGLTPLVYPTDAAAHYREIHKVLSPWAQTPMHSAAGYSGPWIENVFISRFQPLAEAAVASGEPLSAVFGPYIPIFLPWTDLWVNGNPDRFRYPPGLTAALLAVLRPSAAYLVLSQNDEGLTGRNELPLAKLPNVLVLSAGGYGHVPVPLLKQAEAPLPEPGATGVYLPRPHLVNYVGSLGHAPHKFREVAMRATKAAAASLNASTVGWGTYPEWRRVMGTSSASLVLRGFGRTAYHLVETIQLGRVPLYVYSDVPWVPYRKLFEQDLGFVASLADLPRVLARVHALAPAEVAAREARASSLVASHFSFNGTLAQVAAFLVDPAASDLECERLPPTVRGVDPARQKIEDAEKRKRKASRGSRRAAKHKQPAAAHRSR